MHLQSIQSRAKHARVECSGLDCRVVIRIECHTGFGSARMRFQLYRQPSVAVNDCANRPQTADEPCSTIAYACNNLTIDHWMRVS
jgi:hypothetical protein